MRRHVAKRIARRQQAATSTPDHTSPGHTSTLKIGARSGVLPMVVAAVLAGGLAAGFAGSAAAAPLSPQVMPAAAAANGPCPGSRVVPYGLIGDTWRRPDVQDRIGCPGEPEHDVPGRRGRLQTFEHGQIAWTPDQGQHMTIWAIRDKAHFRVQWSSNDPNWSYDKYLIRWDRNRQNIGQRDISGTTEGWWDFQFDTPGTYTFIVEGRSGGGYHHGWTIPVGGTVQPGDIAPPAPNHAAPNPQSAVLQFSLKNDASSYFIIKSVQWTVQRQDLGNARPVVATSVDTQASVLLPVGRQYYIHADVWVQNKVSGLSELAEFRGATKIEGISVQIVVPNANHMSAYSLVAEPATGFFGGINPVVKLTQ